MDFNDLRAKLWRALGLVMLVQAIVVATVLLRSRMREARQSKRKQTPYDSMQFDSTPLEHSDDTARLFMCWKDFCADLIKRIDEADQEILVETYIWLDDSVGRKIRDALVRASERGVRVYAMWDWLQSDKTITREWFSDSIEAFPFRKIESDIRALSPSNMIRDHRKVVVIDSEFAYVGGYNFGKEFASWRDTHLCVRGSAACEVANAFVDFWNQHVPIFAQRLPDVSKRTWNPHVVVHRNDPSLAIFPIRGLYIEAIDRAQERVWITMAYFVPDRSLRNTLAAAARRGVDVRVLLPARSNHALADALAHGTFDELMSAGVRIFLYEGHMVHAKTCVIDSSWTTIGTANLDRWSMLGNYEVNIELRSERIADQMAQMFELDLSQSLEVSLTAWRNRPLHWRFTESMLRTLAPLM